MTTDTQPLAPTDAEIWQLWMPMVRKGVADPVDFARTVLAKWGVQQPLAPIPDLGFILEKRAGVDVLAWDQGGCRPATSTEIAMWHSLAAAPQPVVREPLTDEQKRQRNPYRESKGAGSIWVNGFDAAERAHGIKGGQHGTDTK